MNRWGFDILNYNVKSDFDDKNWEIFSSDKYLYYFTSFHTLNNFILKDKTLLISKIVDSNDPMEAGVRRIIDSLFQDPDEVKKDPMRVTKRTTTISVLNARWNAIIEMKARYLCLSQNVLDGELIKRVALEDDRHWALYGGKHKGACLVFDRDKLTSAMASLSNIEKFYHGDISYKPKPFNGKNAIEFDVKGTDIESLLYEDSVIAADAADRVRDSIDKFFDQNYNDIFFSKTEEWHHETEYRYVILQKSPQKMFVKIDGLLEHIILGVGVDNAMTDEVMARLGSFRSQPVLWHRFHEWGYYNTFPLDY